MTASPIDRPPAAEASESDVDAGTPRLHAVGNPPPRRPTFARLVWYCYGGSLPPENHTWVLHDVTCRTWVLRHFGRWSMAIVPVFLLYLAFMPTPFAIRLYTGITFALAVYVMSFVFILIDTDRRAVRAGYEHSQPSKIRTANSVERQRAANYERRERMAARRQARAARRDF